MRVAVLTTDTPHHTFFVKELSRSWPLDVVVAERRQSRASFPTHHEFEDERDLFEKSTLLDDERLSLKDVADVMEVDDINDAAPTLKARAPDVLIDFGTGLIGADLIAVNPAGILNLHGGDPEEYRGLDTHLWAIYHRDFAALVVTLHLLNEILDDGAIVLQTALPIRQGQRLAHLRASTALACVELVDSVLAVYEHSGTIPSRPQRRRGRYYSHMPSVLKDVCLHQFHRHTGAGL